MTKDEEIEKKVHSTFLSDAEKEKIREQVEKELDAENKKKVAADYKASLISAAKKKALFADAKQGESEDGLVPIFIDLPAVSECVRLDGVAFYPGRTYNVTPQVRDVINEIMHRGREHEDSISGKTAKENAYRKKNGSKVQQ
jgi:hypothetical protein